MNELQHSEDLPTPARPCPRGVTIKAFLVDAYGHEHVTVSHTTIPNEVWLTKPEVIRQSIEQFYGLIGMHLVSLQAQLEAEPVVLAEAPLVPDRPRHLRLITTHGKRIFTEETRRLMESAGLSEAEVRTAVYGEKL